MLPFILPAIQWHPPIDQSGDAFRSLGSWITSSTTPSQLGVSRFEGFPQHLDHGIYFFGPNNTPEKFKKGVNNTFFSGTKNILLHVHGWEVGRIAENYRETFNWKSNEPRYNIAPK